MQTQIQSPAVAPPIPSRSDRSGDLLPINGGVDLADLAVAARIEAIGAQHGFALDAARAMARAVEAGGGGMAQFNHSALGGTGQWMRGGMVMIGDLFNPALAARVGALADDLAGWLASHHGTADEHSPGSAGLPPSHAAETRRSAQGWWPADLGNPNSSGSQNGVRYAHFAAAHRLVVERDGTVALYDTGEHRIGGVSQQQGSSEGGTLQFNSQHGVVDLASLRRLQPADSNAVRSERMRRPVVQTAPDTPDANPQPLTSGDVLDLLPKLADLHARGVLSDDEFTTKKSELLRRI